MIEGLNNIPLHHRAQFINMLASWKSVVHIYIQRKPISSDVDIRGILESSYPKYQPYEMSGLDGYNQLIGVADTGINDLSCFLMDDSNEYTSKVTSRSGKIEMKRRKVIQYTSYADSVDSEGSYCLSM